MIHLPLLPLFFFFNDTATTEIYTLSLHDALPISACGGFDALRSLSQRNEPAPCPSCERSAEHTSELQSPSNLVCRLLLEKNNQASLAVVVTPHSIPSRQPCDA